MFCKNCGKELKDGSAFCSYCGTKVEANPIEEPVSLKPESGFKTGTGNTIENNDRFSLMQQIIGKNTAYYMTQYQRIQKGEKSKLNWASFFLGIFHAGYRNVWKDWLKAVRLPLVIGIGAGLLSAICFFLRPMLGYIFLLIFSVSSIWLLIAQILFSRKFNRIYLNHVEQKIKKEDLKSDPSVVRAFLASLVLVIVYSVISSFISAGMVSAMFESIVSEIDDSDFEDWSDEADNYIEDFSVNQNEEGQEEPQIDEEEPVMDVPAELTVQWEGTWQRELGPAASFTVWTADEDGIFFVLSIGYSGYLAYVDMRDCTAEWIVEGQSAYYEDSYSGYGLEFSYEDGVLIVSESMENPSGLNVSGIYVPEEEADYPSCEYVFAGSDQYEIYEEDCDGLTALECKIAKNEIYARHGRKFQDEALQNYFDSCSWYNGTIEPEDFTEDMLNDIEIANLEVICSYEDYMGF